MRATKKTTRSRKPEKPAQEWRRATRSTLRYATDLVDLEAMRGTEFGASMANSAEKDAKARDLLISPKGALGLPPKLDEARLKYRITDGAFDTQMAFSEVLIHQVGRVGDQLTDHIVAPTSIRGDEAASVNRGILVSAGLRALDALRTNGIELGDMVIFMELAPWDLLVDRKGGAEYHCKMMKVGDIRGSYEAFDRLYRGDARIEWDEEASQHKLVDRVGKSWVRRDPREKGYY